MRAGPIKCFIAMPFGKQDCDALYENKVIPVLRDLDISPIRVDQREHKEDLNVYICRMLEESDIALADLTYARPSVYYEAGYAERKIPVVYTARKDHLDRGQPNDNLRVHFDLEMKKIVHWRDIDDATFASRLRRRMSFLMRPLLSQKEKDERLEQDRADFASQSIKKRIDRIGEQVNKNLLARDFWITTLYDVEREFSVRYLPETVLLGAKLLNKTCYLCVVMIVDSLTPTKIRRVVNRISSYLLISSTDEIEHYEDRYFFLSLKGFSLARVHSILPTAVYSKADEEFIINYCPSGRLEREPGSKLRIVKMPEVQRRKVIRFGNAVDTYRKVIEQAKWIQASFPEGKTNRFTYLAGSNSAFYGGRMISLTGIPKPQ